MDDHDANDDVTAPWMPEPLRERGVLVVGTGSMTHNLSEFFGGQRQPEPYVTEFSRWVATQPPVRAGYVTREVMYAILAMDSFTLPVLAAA